MSEFKVGDRVESVKSVGLVTKGDVGTVSQVQNSLNDLPAGYMVEFDNLEYEVGMTDGLLKPWLVPQGRVLNVPRKTDFEAALDYTLDEVRKVMIDRHAKYGPGNILRHGLMGVVVRLGDKYERLDNNRDQDFADESVDDTILDIIGYGLIARLLRQNAWPGQS